MLYTVKYRKSSSFFWKVISKVKADGILIDAQTRTVLSYRWFIRYDETRIEIPMDNMEFRFEKDRFHAIKASMESELGHKMILTGVEKQ